jgi:hypothetical protein
MLFIAAFIIALSTTSTIDLASCLPPDVKLDDVVSVQTIESTPGVVKVKKTTVRDKLKELGAHCVKGKLLDKTGREIYFHRMVGCWGNPPEDYQEILDRQTKKLAELKERYQVVEMTCNPTGEKIQ